MRPAHRALLCATAAVVAYNVSAPEGETISEGVDELLETHPLLTRIAIMTVAHHLANELLPHADPLGLGFVALRALRRRRVVVVVEA
jgi:hypothetical protein